jgi:hypothetical protein
MNIAEQFYVVGGTLRPDAPCYVERASDSELYASLLRGEVCYALTARQMGKSSLMVRTVRRLRAEGIHVAVLDLTSIGQNLSAEQWYDGLITRLGEQLGLEDELHSFWRTHAEWGPLQRWMTAIERIVLRHREGRIIVFIDELDTVLSLPFSADEFFAGVRECYNRRAQDATFNRLSFVLLGVGAPSDLIRDTRLTPFNIGRRIEIDHFTEAETMALAKGLPCDGLTAQQLVRRVFYWTAGQPYLTQRLCRNLAGALTKAKETERADRTPPHLPSVGLVDELCRSLFLTRKAQERDDNLIFVRERILRTEEDLAALLSTYAGVRRGNRLPDTDRDPLVTTLKLSGVLRPEGGLLRVSNRIYGQVFDLAWVRFNMPEAEVRRQRWAFRRGVLFSTGVGLALLAGLTLLTLNSLRLRPLGLTSDMGDGSIITLEKADFGRVHRYEPGQWRTAWFYQAIGSRSSDSPAARKPSFVSRSQGQTLAFWLTRRSSNTGAYLNFDWWSHFELVDGEGFHYAGTDRMIATDQTASGTYERRPILPTAPPGAHFIAATGSIATWPRRDPSFELRLFDHDAELVASFTVPNPIEASYPIWRAEPLPAVRQTGDLAVSMRGLRGWRTEAELAGRSISVPFLQPNWDLLWKGQPVESWTPESILLSDPTGNSVSVLPARPSSGLPPREQVWRLSAVFYRQPDALFAQAETLEIGVLEIPQRGEVRPCQQEGTVAGLEIELLALVGPGRYHVRDENVVTGEPLTPEETAVLRGSWVLVRSSQVPLRLFAGATIYAGKAFAVVRSSVAGEENPTRLHLLARTSEGEMVSSTVDRLGDLHFLALEDAVDLRLDQARILVNRPHAFEFFIEPPELESTSRSYAELASSYGFAGAIDPRDPEAERQLIDLSEFYNASLQTDWHRQNPGNDLARLPRGIQELGGVRFDIRGVVQVAGTEIPATRFPRQITGMRVELTCQRLHFLHASGWRAVEGTQIGQYVLHYDDGETAVIPLVYGQNTSDWWFYPNDPPNVSDAEVVWQGVNQASLSSNEALRLYKFTWENPRPEHGITQLDLFSTMASSAPYLIAVTAE